MLDASGSDLLAASSKDLSCHELDSVKEMITQPSNSPRATASSLQALCNADFAVPQAKDIKETPREEHKRTDDATGICSFTS